MQGLELILIMVCMAGQAFFSGMETGVISIHRMRLAHFVRKGSARARDLQGLLDHPDRLFGVTLVGTNICVVTTSVLAAGFFSAMSRRFGTTISTAVMTPLVLLLCEYIPKAWFHSQPFRRCSLFVRPLMTAEAVFRPFSWMILNLTSLLVPGTVRTFARRGPFVTREDLKTVVHEGAQHGVLSRDERRMIHRVFELSRKRAGEIMVPYAAMAHIFEDTTASNFLVEARRSGFTRMPVLNRESGSITGIANVFYVLSKRDDPGWAERSIKDLARPPLFIPDTMPVDDIFPHLRRARHPMCFVKNKLGKTLGLITTEDILEEIVGEL